MMSQNKKQDGEHKKNILEYIVFWLSLFLVSTLLIYLTYTAITVKSSPPILKVEYKSHPIKNSPYLYEVTVENQGLETAEEVELEMVLQKDGQSMEKSQMLIQFVPGESKRIIWMNFSKNPSKADSIYTRVVSYKSS